MVRKDASLRMDIDQVLESEWVQGPRSRPQALWNLHQVGITSSLADLLIFITLILNNHLQ